MLSNFITTHHLPEEFRLTVKKYYKPLAEKFFLEFKKNKSTYFVGINGCQGSGKSTLTDYISSYLFTKYQLNVVVMSLDDFYLSSEKRAGLANEIHPLLATRGVPGTHDISALEKTITQLEENKTGFYIPRFNKAIDEPFPKEQWTKIKRPVDIILLEGWCWGVASQTPEQLISPINNLELHHDTEGIWRNYVNDQLKNNYEPLYEKMNFWLALQAPSFDCVYKWRLEQEQKLQAKNIALTNSKIMSSQEVFNFTQYFQRLTVHSSNITLQYANDVFYLDDSRHITDTASIEKELQ